MIPDRFGKYRVLRRIASGGMAEVYLCRLTGEEGFRKRVALKVVHPRHADDPRFRELFAREARLAASLSHPNLVQVFDFGREGDAHFLAMEYVEGWNLAQAAEQARQLHVPISPGVWRHWVDGIGSGLAYLHEKGVVHRDVSPGNVLVARNGAVKITDFGISRAAGDGQENEGTRAGKSGYLAPERIRGEGATSSSDLFAAGVISVELLLGRRLFEGDGPEEILDSDPAIRRADAPASRRFPRVGGSPAEVRRGAPGGSISRRGGISCRARAGRPSPGIGPGDGGFLGRPLPRPAGGGDGPGSGGGAGIPSGDGQGTGRAVRREGKNRSGGRRRRVRGGHRRRRPPVEGGAATTGDRCGAGFGGPGTRPSSPVPSARGRSRGRSRRRENRPVPNLLRR